MARSTFRRFLLFWALASSACAVAPSPGPAAGERTVTDDLGREVRVAAKPRRIVSLAPNLTEIVFALGAGDRLIANTSFCDFPAQAKEKVRVGDTQKPDMERIISLKPDLVIVSTASQLEGISERLAALGVPVFVSNPRNLDGVLSSIERLGDVIGEREASTQLAGKLRERLTGVQDRVGSRPPMKVFLIVSDEPLITSGKGTFIDDLVRRAGGVSISGDEATEWPQYSVETVIARAPDAIVVPTMAHGISQGGDTIPGTLAGTPAVRNGQIIRIDADLLMRPGPRLIDGVEALARALHPEAFR